MQRSQRQPRPEHHHSVENAEDSRDSNNSKQLMQHPTQHHDGQVAAQPQNSRGAPAVRLDMDLDIEVELKAKIKGYVTLAILVRRNLTRYTDQLPSKNFGPLTSVSSCLESCPSHYLNTMSSQRTNRTRKSTSKRSKDGLKPVEILSQVGRVALPFILTKLAQQQEEKQRQQEKERETDRKYSSSRSRSRKSSVARAPSSAGRSGAPRDKGRERAPGSDGPGDSSPRDDSDFHGVISQVAVGLVAFGARKLMQRRKEAKRAAASAAQTSQAKGRNARGNMGPADADVELSRALDATAVELQGASESIRRLASSGSESHHGKCEVKEALVKDAERLEGSLANIQTNIHNMRNLHPRLHFQTEGKRENIVREKRGVDRPRSGNEGRRDRLKKRYKREPLDIRPSLENEEDLAFSGSGNRRRPK
ncbi:hypothetical protein QBC40DRAFT_234430 [Triangularia verruculosa]|uniref:Uncharacterized protein n=1 Tax=Triangularia verruculosa TaxID=2587418 RepID=A0AAN7AS21_9PEZI|nr:hypothetical protein QBC40DRAFT_234430 [Triangularia verruculosa]